MTYESKREWLEPGIIIEDRAEAEKLLSLIMESRGLSSKELERFLNPDISRIYSHNLLYDTKSATTELLDWIESGLKIFIHGDYDADGICATSLLWEFIYRNLSNHLGKDIDVVPYIPSREDEGYGLSENSLDAMIEAGAQAVITVDCGVRDSHLIAKYQDKGLKFIITDHHQPPDDLIDNLKHILVHPMYPEKEYQFQSISGAFVAFLFVQAIKEKVGMKFELSPETEGIDLVGVSTVTDIMPLTDINRDVLFQGLIQLNKTNRIGLNELYKVSSLSHGKVSSYHLGYVIGPRINAAGRIGDPLDGVRLLTTQSQKQATELASHLDSLNIDRQKMTDELISAVESQVKEESQIIIALGDDWNEGIIGLVAGKICEKYSKPTIVMSKTKDGYKGSARSLGDFNITDALSAKSDYLVKYGGHAHAAGFTVKKSDITQFIDEMYIYANEIIGDKDLVSTLAVDVEISSSVITVSIVESLSKLEPYGYKNKKPLFLLRNAVILDKKTLGKDGKHMKLTVIAGGKGDIACILFDCKEDIEKLSIDDRIDIVGTLDLNTYKGNTDLQFLIKEWRRV